MELRAFYHKTNFQPQAIASAYLEITSPGDKSSTKLSCSIYGPMQKDQSFSQSEQCQIKVTIDFADSSMQDSLILQQYPDVEEQLRAQMMQMPSQVAADSVKEKRMKQIVGSLQFELVKVFTSTILVKNYPATQILFNFNIIELDSDILSSMINCASLALNSSPIECRCIPAAVCLLVKAERVDQSNSVVLQPYLTQIRNQVIHSHKANFVFNVDTEEIISSIVKPIGNQSSSLPLDLSHLETLTGVALSAARRVHQQIMEDDQA